LITVAGAEHLRVTDPCGSPVDTSMPVEMLTTDRLEVRCTTCGTTRQRRHGQLASTLRGVWDMAVTANGPWHQLHDLVPRPPDPKPSREWRARPMIT
jgi:hypothetical protein